MKKPTYITTSIAYVNAEPHIGFLYELLTADVLKRYHRSLGEEVFLLTGTDEHGIKVAQAAEAAGQTPQEFADKLSTKFKDLGRQFNIDFDYFIRTTDPVHKKFVQEKWRQLARLGLLKKKRYTGLYCSGCEAFKAEGEIQSGKCAIHEKELEKIEEENYFLTGITKFKSRITKWINEAVFPASRRQEVINILKSGVYDEISVSRSKERYGWGVSVPGDDSQIMYVWVDALFNYISALEINGKTSLWPADVQIIGKDILKFHAIIWPALLLATGYDLPKKLLVHGFINVDGKKMSKSLGNVIAPAQLLKRYGAEATRYLLCRQLSFYDDSNFTWDDFDRVYNGELANGLGNLVARVIGILKKFGGGTQLSRARRNDSSKFEFENALNCANDEINSADQLISREKLWENPSAKKEQVKAVLQHLSLAVSELEPFLPGTAAEIRRQLTELDPKPIFPRLGKAETLIPKS